LAKFKAISQFASRFALTPLFAIQQFLEMPLFNGRNEGIDTACLQSIWFKHPACNIFFMQTNNFMHIFLLS